MRVLHIISGDLWAGAEVQAFTLLTSLREMKKVTVCAALMNEGALAAHLREADVPVAVFPESAFGPAKLFWKLRQFMAHWRPDVIHTHRDKENILGALANRASVNGICVRTAHGQNEHLHRGVVQRLDRWCGMHLQHGIVAVTADLAGKLRSQMPKANITVIENGVDCERVRRQLKPVTFVSRWPKALHVGIVGRLVPVKRVDIFLEIAALLLRQCSDRQWMFHVIGDGDLRSTLQERAKAMGIDAAVNFHGHRPDSISCVAALDALIICSDHEGLPMTALEAICVGTPVIAHAVGGLKEILSYAANSVLIVDNLPERYAEVLRTWIGGAPGVAPAVLPEKYSARENARKICEFYENLRSAPHGR